MFEKLTLSRLIILFSFLGSAAVGWLLYRENQRLVDYQDAIDTAKLRVPVIVNKAQELEDLMKAAAREEFGSDVKALESYITQRATDTKVNIGQIEISKPQEQIIESARNGTAGIMDLVYRVSPARSGRGEYSRSQVSNFVYLLEQDSRRVRVTGITLSPTERSPKKDRFLNDRWTFDVDLRVRQKVEPSAN